MPIWGHLYNRLCPALGFGMPPFSRVSAKASRCVKYSVGDPNVIFQRYCHRRWYVPKSVSPAKHLSQWSINSFHHTFNSCNVQHGRLKARAAPKGTIINQGLRKIFLTDCIYSTNQAQKSHKASQYRRLALLGPLPKHPPPYHSETGAPKTYLTVGKWPRHSHKGHPSSMAPRLAKAAGCRFYFVYRSQA